MEVLDDQFSINSALPRTLGALFFRPGHLTREYMSGRIARYIPPFRLYLVASVAFFVALSLLPELRDPLANSGITQTTVTVGFSNGREGARAGDPLRPRPPLPVAPRPGVLAAGDTGAAARAPRLRAIAPPVPPPPVRTSFLNGWKFATGNTQLDSTLNERLRHFRSMDPRDASRQLIRGYLDHVPQMMFIMLPLFAALLKALYLRSRRFYVEHFVFALHLHAFAFLTYLAMIAARWPPLVAVLWMWMFLYLYVALKRVYREGWMTTAIKYATLGATYFVAVGIAALLTFVATVLTA